MKNFFFVFFVSCFFSFGNVINLIAGRSTKWEIENFDKKDFKCEFCEGAFGSRDDYVNHFFYNTVNEKLKVKDILCGPKKCLANCRICNNKMVNKRIDEFEHIYRVHIEFYGLAKFVAIKNELNLEDAYVFNEKEDEAVQTLVSLSKRVLVVNKSYELRKNKKVKYY